MADEKKNVPGPDALGDASAVGDKAAEDESAAIVAKKLDKVKDFTGDEPVADRVLAINLPFFKYGTSDRFQGAAILLALSLLLLITGLFVWSFLSEIPDNRFDKIFGWLGSAFLLVMGVAIGRGASGKDN